MPIKESELAPIRQACTMFIRELLRVVGQRMDTWPSKEEKMTFFEGDKIRIKYSPDYFHYFYHLKQPKLSCYEQADFPKSSAQKCVELLWSYPKFLEGWTDSNEKPIKPKHGCPHTITRYLVDEIAYTLVKEKKSLRVSDKAIQKGVNKFIDIWLLEKKYPRPISKEYITVPLYNVGYKKEKATFSSECGRIVSLRHFTDTRKNQIWNVFGDMAEDLGIMKAQGLSKSELFLTMAKVDRNNSDDCIQCALSALRLSSSGKIFSPGIIGAHIPPSGSKGYHGILDGFLPPPQIRLTQRNASELNKLNTGSFVELTEPTLLKARKLFRLLSADNMTLWKGFHIAISRFNKTYSRTEFADIIIDLSIALESVLVGKESEIGYKLRMRGTRLLSHIGGLKDVYLFLKVFYNIRSEMVHNGKTFEDKDVKTELSKLGNISPQDFVEQARTITRDIIISGLERKKLPEKLRKFLDDEIVKLTA